MSNNIQKGHKPTTIMEVPGAKARYCMWSLQAASTTGWADLLSYPSSPTHSLVHPPLTLFEEPACPPWRASKSTCYLFSLSHATAQVSITPCLEFSSALLSISTDERVQGRRLVTLFIYLITINAEHYGESQLHGASRRTVLDNKAPCLLPLSISFTFFLLYT